jgi:hypothetical protein
MSSNANTPEIDLSAINSEISAMSPEALQAEVLKLRVRQKKQQKKQQGAGSQKAYQKKQQAKFKLMKEQAIKLGLWDKLNEQAEAEAERQLAAEADESVDVDEKETADVA